MNQKLGNVFLLIAFAATILPSALARAAECQGARGLGEFEIGDGTPSHTFYLDDRDQLFGNGIWLYQESNGKFVGGDPYQDLQRGGSSRYVPNDTDLCTDYSLVGPDTLIF